MMEDEELLKDGELVWKQIDANHPIFQNIRPHIKVTYKGKDISNHVRSITMLHKEYEEMIKDD